MVGIAGIALNPALNLRDSHLRDTGVSRDRLPVSDLGFRLRVSFVLKSVFSVGACGFKVQGLRVWSLRVQSAQSGLLGTVFLYESRC